MGGEPSLHHGLSSEYHTGEVIGQNGRNGNSEDEDEDEDEDERLSRQSPKKRKRADELAHLLSRLTQSASSLINLEDLEGAGSQEETSSKKSETDKGTGPATQTRVPASSSAQTSAKVNTTLYKAEASDEEDDEESMSAIEQMNAILRRAGGL